MEADQGFSSILLVEDDEATSSLLKKQLGRIGYSVDTVHSGKAALSRMNDNRPDLMLLDFRLPDMTGRELILKLQENGNNVPFIVITGYGDEQVAVEMMKLGARDYLSKGKNFVDLLPEVVNHIMKDLQAEQRLEEYRVKLSESRELIKKFMDEATVILCIWDKNLDLININSSAGRYLPAGVNLENIIGKNIRFFANNLDNGEELELYQKVVQTGVSITFELEYKKSSAEKIWLSIRAFKVGEGLGIIATDITESVMFKTERERLISELREALENVKTLKGLIPICANCKKIRDDKGYWNQVEEYIRARTEAEFSHSLCPDCKELLFKDFLNDERVP